MSNFFLLLFALCTHTYRELNPQTPTHLSVSAYGSSTVCEQLGHVVVAVELPQTRFQVQVPVEAQRAVPPQRAAELIRHRVSHALRAARGRGDEPVASGDLVIVQHVGTAVVPYPGSIGAEGEVEVHERASGDDRKHACKEGNGT